MATRKSGGSTSLGRDSMSQRLGVKLSAGQQAQPGSIIIRQRGTSFNAGENVRRGKDDTLYAVATGTIHFTRKRIRAFNGNIEIRKFVSVIPTASTA